MVDAITSLHGRRLGLGPKGNLVGLGKEITRPAVDARITVGAEETNVRAIKVELLDASGNKIAERQFLRLYVLADASGNAFAATGGSTGIAVGADGALLALVAKKAFIAITEDDGDLDLTWTDTGSEAAYLAVELPNGRVVISAAMTNAE